MDSIRGEVSNKIRSAIKAKLMELGAYVDDELPDYIMVMVANKRSQQQMEDDLLLFLGDSTVTFTSWLHTVLSKLQQVTVNSAELKKGSEKKRPSSEEHKKEKRKKIKKEKPEKFDSALDGRKTKERLEEPHAAQPRTSTIKSESDDHRTEEGSLGSASHVPNTDSQSNSSRIQKSRNTEEEDEEDFINLKADVETDLWGDSEDTAVAASKGTNAESKQQSAHRATASNQDPQQVHLGRRLDSTSEEIFSNPIPLESVSNIPPSSKDVAAERTSATRTIKISETREQEQETLKPASKIVRDPQNLVKRVFQSHIVSQKHVQEKSERSRLRSSSSSRNADSHNRRSDHRRNRKHEHEDLRETLRKERQKEREVNRNRERDQRRSRSDTQPRNSRTANASLSRAPLSYKDENESDHNLASVVQIKSRPKIPAALQANRSLLKAVAEAQKSVTTPIIRSELTSKALKEAFMKKSVKDRLDTSNRSNVKSRLANKEQHELKQLTRLPPRETLKKMSFTVVSKNTAPSKESKESVLAEYGDEEPFILDPTMNILIQVPASPVAEHRPSPDPAQTEKVRRWIKDVEEATKAETTPSNVHADMEAVTETDADPFAGLEGSSKPPSEIAIDDSDDALDVDTTSLKTSDINSVVTTANQPSRPSIGPQFVVTLDGLDPMLMHSYSEEEGQNKNTLKQRSQTLDDIMMQDDKEDDSVKEQLLRQELLRQQAAVRELKASRSSNVTTPPASASSKAPIKRPASPNIALEIRPSKITIPRTTSLERCKFWPACKNKDKCEFHHPTVQCKMFPKCIFADRCLYIHPTCRFNTACTRADCVYAHTNSKVALKSPPKGNNTGVQSIKQACKFFPNCSNLSCPYLHPVVCKFGTHCTKATCQYIHSDKGLNSKHKWVRQ